MPAIELRRRAGDDPDFLSLLPLLDAELDERNPNTRSFFGPLNTTDRSFKVVLAYDGEYPVACCALKRPVGEEGALEVKRLFVRRDCRGRGLSRLLLEEVESWARELSARRLILETGARQTEALSLYNSFGFEGISNYGVYVDSPLSICMAKAL